MSNPKNEPPLVTLHNVALGYDSRVVLRDISLEIYPAQIWCVLGRNGQGKTTLLRGILGSQKPLSGVRNSSFGGAAAYVSQFCTAVRSLPTTVAEYIALGLVGVRLTKTERGNRLRTIIQRCGLEQLAERQFHSLSGGERQRARIGRALVRRPRLLALDEPTVGLDRGGRDELMQLIKELSVCEELAVVIVTHDLEFANRVARYLLFVDEGIVAIGESGGVQTAFESTTTL